MARIAVAMAILAGAMTVAVAVAAGYGDQTVRLTGNHPVEAENNVAIGNADANQPLAMEVRFALRDRALLDRLLAELQDPASPKYHQWLKTGEFEARFGARPTDVSAVAKWLVDEGFTVDDTGEGYLRFKGTAAQAERSFAVKILKFGDGSVYGHAEDPAIPRNFAGVIGSIIGLDNMMNIKAASVRQTETGKAKINNHESFGPADLRTFYDETPLLNAGNTGAGECIAIIGNSDFLDAAVTTFNTHFGLPPSSITRVLADGSNPGTNEDESEAHLDLEWSHVTAPGAPTTFYLGDPAVGFVTSLLDAITQAAKDNTCAVMSVSFILCGSSNAFLKNVMDPQFAKAAAQGQSVVVSSGDDGAAGLEFDSANGQCVVGSSKHANEMSADTNVSSIGGTSFDPKYDSEGNDIGSAPERVWNDPDDGIDSGGAGGGGPSAVFSKPAYQTGMGVPTDTMRDTPDVSLIASPNFPGVFIGDDDGSGNAVFQQFGGTSLSAPVWGGIAKVLAQLSGHRQGNLNPTIYRLANQNLAGNGFRDVTSGNNSFHQVAGFNASTGYDEATGWGTVDIAAFISAATSSKTPETTLVATPSQINLGSVDASSSGKPQKVTITNTGPIAAMVGKASVTVGFSIAAKTDLCSNQPVGPMHRCTIMVQFSPTAPGPASGSLSIPYNGAAPATVSLSGTGTAVSMKAPPSVMFSPVAAKSIGAQKPVSIVNLSKTASVQMGAAILGGPFEIATNNCSGLTVGPKGKCTIELKFAPPSGSPSNSVLQGSLNLGFSYGSNGGAVPAISLSGRVK